jgi:preprotein translocase subunit SecB
MEQQVKKAKFKLNNFIISKSLIDIKSDKIGKEFSFGFKPQGKIYSNEKRFELKLGLVIEDNANVLKIQLDAIGNFIFAENLKQDELSNYFYVNAPAILFPYIRAYVSSLTALSGINTVIMPTLNMQYLGDELKKYTTTID